MPGDWRNSVTEELPGFGLGDLSEGEEIQGRFLDEGSLTDTKHGEALQIGFAVETVPTGYEDMNGQEVEEGEDYHIMTSSSRFMYALKEYADSVTGEDVTLSAEGESFERTYHIEDN